MSLSTLNPNTGLSGLFFNHFVQGRLQNEAPQLLHRLGSTLSESRLPPDMQNVANSLLQVAADFANSPERQRVRDMANQADLNLTPESLIQLLGILLDPRQQERLVERIITIFFFCLDYLLRLACQGLGRMLEFLRWCKDAIMQVLDPIVIRAGGWETVVSVAKTTGILVTAATVIVGIGLLIGKILTKA